jgi:mannose-6-phosphate isomerase-like protein (cupin superfamily)
MPRYRFVPSGGGTSYNWARDHTFVKVATADTDGAYALLEDNLKREFSLGLHLHRQHAESFYILEGQVDFYIDGDWLTATAASTVHIPPGIAHAVTLEAGQTAKMLMIFRPDGFDRYLAELATMSAQQLADKKLMEELAVKYDIIDLAGVPER